MQLTEAVTKCFYTPDTDKYINCNNSVDLASGYLATGHACVFVKNISLTNPNGATSIYISRCNAVSTDGCPTGLTGQTGLIYVDGNYPRKTYEKANSNFFAEARGIPCFRVEVDTASARTPATAGAPVYIENLSSAGPPSAAIQAAPESVRQCLYSGTTPTGEAKKSLLPCGNDAAGLTNDPYDFIGHNAAGTSNDVSSKLTRGTCWYVINTKVKNLTGTYTGWVRFNSDLPAWGSFTGGVAGISSSSYTINGTVCSSVLSDN